MIHKAVRMLARWLRLTAQRIDPQPVLIYDPQRGDYEIRMPARRLAGRNADLLTDGIPLARITLDRGVTSPAAAGHRQEWAP